MPIPNDPLLDGVVLTIVGMLTVFAFLTIMVVAISVSAKIIARFAPAPAASPAIVPVEYVSENNAQVAIVLAAVRHARKGRG